MKLLSATQILAIGGVIIAGGTVFFLLKRTGGVLSAVNPANSDNLVNQGFNEVVFGTESRGSNQTLGTFLFELFVGDEE